MRIVTPYGRSEADGKRRLKLKPLLEERREIPEFAQGDDRLVIAQWISAIDKIATKPRPNKKPTQEQRDFRERLGEACWELIGEKALLHGNLPEEIDAETLWRSKIHPYGKENPKPKNTASSPSAKGRWYGRFAGDVADVAEADAKAIAEKIYEHLYEGAYRPDPKAPRKRKGLIQSRAASAETTVLRPARPADGPAWSNEDIERYLAPDDVAAADIEVPALSPRRGDFNDDLQTFGPRDLRAALRPKLAPQDAARFMRPGTSTAG